MRPPSYPSAWLHPCRARFRFTWQAIVALLLTPPAAGAFDAVGALPPTCGLVPRGSPPDARLACRRRNESDRAVQEYGVIAVHVLLNQPPRILRRQRRS